MYAKSFIALDGNGRLTGARTAQQYPYDGYTCHLCGSAAVRQCGSAAVRQCGSITLNTTQSGYGLSTDTTC